MWEVKIHSGRWRLNKNDGERLAELLSFWAARIPSEFYACAKAKNLWQLYSSFLFSEAWTGGHFYIVNILDYHNAMSIHWLNQDKLHCHHAHLPLHLTFAESLLVARARWFPVWFAMETSEGGVTLGQYTCTGSLSNKIGTGYGNISPLCTPCPSQACWSLRCSIALRWTALLHLSVGGVCSHCHISSGLAFRFT